MIEKNKAEEYLFNLINVEEHKVIINIVREVVQKIWSSEVRIVREYTDHGYEHSQRIINKIYEILKPFHGGLSEDEVYLLLLGVYLHDIGMQCDIKKHPMIKELAVEKYSAKFEEKYAEGTANSYTPEEQNEIRGNHHLLTGAWIEYSYKNETILSQFVRKIDSVYLDDLITICIYHSKLSINDCPKESDLTDIRLRLVAAILRFGDELDIDRHRVHIETVNEFSYNTENAVFWYLHSRTAISIKDSAVKVSVYLNEEDYREYSTCINNIYIQKFKTKNKVLTDIMTQGGINIFISEDSATEIIRFEEKLPDEIALNLKKMFWEQIQGETITKLELINKESGKETLKQILDSSLGKKEKINFMQKYESEFISEANKIKLLIDELKVACHVPGVEVDEIIDVFSSLRWKPDISIIQKNEAILAKAYKIFLFIKAFTAEQLRYLSDDIKLSIPIQVVSGDAQYYALCFFDAYLKCNDDPEALEKCRSFGWNFDSYTCEQIGRILRAYKEIINFNTENIKFSDYYIYPNASDGKLLAASVGGEANKILVWNIENRRHEPIAALGGLMEPVRNIKIYRYKGETIITAHGTRQIFFWNLNSSSGEPTYILKSKHQIIDYILFESLDNHLYAMGLTMKQFCIWKLFESESPDTFFQAERDVYVINTHLSGSENTYECLGHDSFGDNEYPKIIELVETAPLEFKKKQRFDIYKTIDIDQCSADGYGNRLNAYAVDKKSGDVYLLINNNIYMFDSELRLMDEREGQRILGLASKNRNEKTCLLTYSIYQGDVEQIDLIHYYRIEHKKIAEHKKWEAEPHDVVNATLSEVNEEQAVYFNYGFNNKIYRIDCNTDKCTVFYTLPETFDIKHMISE